MNQVAWKFISSGQIEFYDKPPKALPESIEDLVARRKHETITKQKLQSDRDRRRVRLRLVRPGIVERFGEIPPSLHDIFLTSRKRTHALNHKKASDTQND